MPSDLCVWHQMGSFSPGRLNTGRLPQPGDAHCRLRACSGNRPAQGWGTTMVGRWTASECACWASLPDIH